MTIIFDTQQPPSYVKLFKVSKRYKKYKNVQILPQPSLPLPHPVHLLCTRASRKILPPGLDPISSYPSHLARISYVHGAPFDRVGEGELHARLPSPKEDRARFISSRKPFRFARHDSNVCLPLSLFSLSLFFSLSKRSTWLVEAILYGEGERTFDRGEEVRRIISRKLMNLLIGRWDVFESTWFTLRVYLLSYVIHETLTLL